MSASIPRMCAIALLATLVSGPVAAVGTPDTATAHTKCLGTVEAGAKMPVPADPFPFMAAGWGPELGGGIMASRWAEDWSCMATAGRVPVLKAIPVGEAAQLTLSSEIRLRHAVTDNAQLRRGRGSGQTQLRAVIGGDLRINPYVRVFGEMGTGHVDGHQDSATANFQNEASLQQLFVDFRASAGPMLIGTMIGRQEFSDGPRQLISLSDGPNLHRTWNGARFYAHHVRYRLGAFDLRATGLGRGGFDEDINHAEKLQGLNASFIVSNGDGLNTYLEAFWLHTGNPVFRVAGRTGLDDRDTVVARLWGRRGSARFDWTVARQTGRTVDDRLIDAWGIFAVQSLVLSETGWKLRVTSRIDVASGGGAYSGGSVRDFNPLYASSNYLGEGRFLSLSNLLMFTPGIELTPTVRTTFSLEYGCALRLDRNDAVYAGGMRPYIGTQSVPGRRIGGLGRLTARWSASRNFSLSGNIEHMTPGDVLERAGHHAGTYSYVSAVYRF